LTFAVFASTRLQENQLFIADPKALQHIFQTCTYEYEKPSGERALLSLLLDRGILWAKGALRASFIADDLIVFQAMFTKGNGE
jgi:uncharacterized membrane protein